MYSKLVNYVDFSKVKEMDIPLDCKIFVGQEVYFYIFSLEKYKVEKVNKKSFTITKTYGNKTQTQFKVDYLELNKRLFTTNEKFLDAVKENIDSKIEEKEQEIKALVGFRKTIW